jgi:single-strand DNA-binding protein
MSSDKSHLPIRDLLSIFNLIIMTSLKNSVHLIGRLGNNPQVKNFESGKKMASFSLATNETYLNNKGEKIDDTQWHNIVVWGKKADIAEKYLKKGSEVALEGKLINRSYEHEGVKKHITEISLNEVLMLDKKD